MRRGSLFWGIIVFMAGVVMLLQNLNLLPEHFWAFFWPGVLILLGGWFLLAPFLFRRKSDVEQVSIPLDEANEVEVCIRHGAGRLEIHALSNPGYLAEGSFAGGVDYEVHRLAGRTRLNLRAPSEWFVGITPASHEGYSWSVGLNRDLPTRLDLKTGASESDLDLSDLRVTELALETGASSTRITMPAHAGMTRARIISGVASVSLCLPSGVAGRIRATSGLASINVDSGRFPFNGSYYETPGFDSAVNKVEVSIETGVGSFDIR